MNVQNNKSGFTLLEIIIVLIILTVLASLAFPTFTGVIERSRAAEGIKNVGMLRGGFSRCGVRNNSNYATCTIATIDVQDPGGATNSHFTYSSPGAGATTFAITATRNTNNNGDGSSTITLIQDDGAGTVVQGGTGAFAGI